MQIAYDYNCGPRNENAAHAATKHTHAHAVCLVWINTYQVCGWFLLISCGCCCRCCCCCGNTLPGFAGRRWRNTTRRRKLVRRGSNAGVCACWHKFLTWLPAFRGRWSSRRSARNVFEVVAAADDDDDDTVCHVATAAALAAAQNCTSHYLPLLNILL